MAWVTEDFLTTWQDGRQVGEDRPRCVVEVRRGNWRRDYRAWPDLVDDDGVHFSDIDAVIPGEPVAQLETDSFTGPAAIPDNNPTGVLITFDMPAGDVTELSLYVTHTFVGDLVITLTPPDGTPRTLVNRRGDFGENLGASALSRFRLRDGAAASVTTLDPDDAPWTGSWKPETLFGTIASQEAGTWTMKVRDAAGADTGSVQAASLILSTGDGYWYPIFTETTAWEELPNVLSVEVTKGFDQRGIPVATIVMDNVEYVARTGSMGHAYHSIERGYYAPYRGETPEFRGAPADWPAANAWAGKVDEMADVRIWMGYGDPERDDDGILLSGGTNGAWVFRGLVDDVDLDAAPARITLTVRSAKLLTDSRVFGWNKSRQLHDPVTFMDAFELAGEGAVTGLVMTPGTETIAVDDVSDMVRIALRWAGYQEWEIEDAGVRLNGRFVVNRANYLIDIITAACEQTGFTFFVADPTDGESQGVPTFRRNAATIREKSAVAAEVRDTDLIGDLRAKLSETPRGYIIRVRGKTSRSGVALGGDNVERIMAVYRPPWTTDNTMAGVIKHVTYTNNKLRNEKQCLAGCYLIAIAEALEAASVAIDVPGFPLVELDDQVGLLDTATGINSRMWVSGVSTTFTIGEKTSWTTSITGALIDTPDLVAVIDEILDLDWTTATEPATATGTRRRRVR